MSYKTPLGKVRGLGSAKSGTGHFWDQRMTALANLPLVIGVLIIGVLVWGKPYQEVIAFLQNPIVAIILGLFIVNTCVHMRLGMQIIIEDYVSGEGKKFIFLALNTFFCVLVGVCALYALAKINFGM